MITYFVLGTILLSLSRYITLESNWFQERLHIPAEITRRWFVYSAVVLATLVLLISWLPTNYGLGLFATLNGIFHLIYLAFQAVFGFILLIISLVARLFIKTPPGFQTQIPTITPPPGNLPSSPVSTFNWNLVKSIFLWTSLMVLGIIALRQYIAFNRDLSEDLRRFRPLHWLIGA